MRRSGWRAVVGNLAALALGIVLPLCAAEGVLRFLPVNTGLRSVATNAAQPVFHFTPNHRFVFSQGWDLAMANEGWVNNAGFVNDQDYQHSGPPMLGVVGDSYVEALMVPYPKTLQGRLADRTGARARVYSFAASGAPLSQYLAFARHAVRDWGASALVIVVIGNDFDESLASVKQGPGFFHYVQAADGALHLDLTAYAPNPLARIAVNSALVRYLVFNLKAGEAWDMLRQWGRERGFVSPAVAATTPSAFEGNTSAESSSSRLRASEQAVTAFFRDLPEWSGLPPDRILFVVDGIRYPPAADHGPRQSYFVRMRDYFMAQATAKGYEVIDVDPVFFAHAERTGDRLEYPRDGHWNPTAHGLVAEMVERSALFRGLTP
jgi:hypothetical protein